MWRKKALYPYPCTYATRPPRGGGLNEGSVVAEEQTQPEDEVVPMAQGSEGMSKEHSSAVN